MIFDANFGGIFIRWLEGKSSSGRLNLKNILFCKYHWWPTMVLRSSYPVSQYFWLWQKPSTTFVWQSLELLFRLLSGFRSMKVPSFSLPPPVFLTWPVASKIIPLQLMRTSIILLTIPRTSSRWCCVANWALHVKKSCFCESFPLTLRYSRAFMDFRVLSRRNAHESALYIDVYTLAWYAAGSVGDEEIIP